jgi:hypothetical protein
MATPYIAIDIVLLPSQIVDQLIIQLNQQFIDSNAADISYTFSSTLIPHLSLIQIFILRSNLTNLYKEIEELIKIHPFCTQLTKLYIGPQFDSYHLPCLDVARSKELFSLHEQLAKLCNKYCFKPSDDDRNMDKAFYKDFDDEIINPASISWVNEYLVHSSNSSYNPHITLGAIRQEEFLQIQAKSHHLDFNEQQYKWLNQDIHIYQLGNYCTCRKQLRRIQFVPSSGEEGASSTHFLLLLLSVQFVQNTSELTL